MYVSSNTEERSWGIGWAGVVAKGVVCGGWLRGRGCGGGGGGMGRWMRVDWGAFGDGEGGYMVWSNVVSGIEKRGFCH